MQIKVAKFGESGIRLVCLDVLVVIGFSLTFLGLVDVASLHINDIRVLSTSLHPCPPCCQWALVVSLSLKGFSLKLDGLVLFINLILGSHCPAACH